MKRHDILRFIAAIAICEGAGVLGFFVTVGAIPVWYASLAKPDIAPPHWVFGPVWIALYALMGVALFLVWKHDWKVVNPILVGKGRAWNKRSERLWTGDLQRINIVALFWIQLALNALWSILFFGMRAPAAAFFEIIALWVSIFYVIVNFYRVSKTAAWLLIPYLLWVGFAAYLNFEILILN